MSRGLGSFQKRVISELEKREDYELPMPDLRRRLEADKALLRRAVRSLEIRDLAERRYEMSEGRSVCFVRYTWPECYLAVLIVSDAPDDEESRTTLLVERHS